MQLYISLVIQVEFIYINVHYQFVPVFIILIHIVFFLITPYCYIKIQQLPNKFSLLTKTRTIIMKKNNNNNNKTIYKWKPKSFEIAQKLPDCRKTKLNSFLKNRKYNVKELCSSNYCCSEKYIYTRLEKYFIVYLPCF